MSAYPLLSLPSWDTHTRSATVRVTALLRTRQGLRAVTAEAPTEADALAALAARGVRW